MEYASEDSGVVVRCGKKREDLRHPEILPPETIDSSLDLCENFFAYK
jgi:hypothetical protein